MVSSAVPLPNVNRKYSPQSRNNLNGVQSQQQPQLEEGKTFDYRKFLKDLANFKMLKEDNFVLQKISPKNQRSRNISEGYFNEKQSKLFKPEKQDANKCDISEFYVADINKNNTQNIDWM